MTTTAAGVARRASVRRPSPRGGSNRSNGLPWILPAFLFVAGIIYYSIGYTVYISTLDWDGLSPRAVAVGAGNYVDMATDPVFWASLEHTALLWVVTFVTQTALGFVLAAIMHSRVYLKTLHKIVIFVPVLLAPATMAPVFRLYYAPDGLANEILRAVGLDALAQPWLAQADTALPVIMLITVWQWTGLTFILYYAAMSQIQPELLEAARLDRANNLQTLWHVVWPGCKGTTVALGMLSFIGALKTFDVPYLVTAAGPYNSTEFLGTYIYRIGIRQAQIGYAGALSIVLLVLAITGAIIIARANRPKVGER